MLLKFIIQIKTDIIILNIETKEGGEKYEKRRK